MGVPTSFEEPTEGLPAGQQAELRLQEGERTGEGRARGRRCGTQRTDGVAWVGRGAGDGFREIWLENQMNSGI